MEHTNSVSDRIRSVLYKAGYYPEDFPDSSISALSDWLIKEHDGHFTNLMIWNLKDGYDDIGYKNMEVWISLNAGKDISTWWSSKSLNDSTFTVFEPNVWVTNIPDDYDFWKWWRKDFCQENKWFKELKKKSF